MGKADVKNMATDDSPGGWKAWWQRVPGPIRKTLVLTVGLTLIATGLLLIVLPGPFTIPLLIAGLAIMATEFAWAAAMTGKARHHGERLWDVVRGAWRDWRSGGSSDKGRAVHDLPSKGQGTVQHDGDNKQKQERPDPPGASQQEGEQ